MNLTSLSNQKLYLNTSQHQTYTIQKIKKLSQKWTKDLKSNKIPTHTFKKLLDTHFENLTEIPKYELIQNKKHSIQCSYVIECSCSCWCKGKFHGKMVTQDITQ